MIMVQGHKSPAYDSAGPSRLSVSDRIKRKLSTAQEGEIMNIATEDGPKTSQSDVKKIKTSSGNSSFIGTGRDRLFFTAATEPIWRRIFAYLPPASLGCLLRVNLFFKGMLESPTSRTNNIFGIDKPLLGSDAAESTWNRCRRGFAPGLPQPLVHQSELAMWRLIKGNRCHECGIRKPLLTLSNAVNEWTSGPEQEQTRIIWAFRVRICGSCLCRLSTTEKDLVLDTSFPSFLIDGLPFVLLLNSDNVVSESTFRRCACPFGSKTSKIFFKPQIQFLKDRFLTLKEGDASTLQSWLSNLPLKREEIESDASRWEAWEVKGTLAKINSKALASTKPRSQQHSFDDKSARKAEISAQLKTPHCQDRNGVTPPSSHFTRNGSVKTNHVKVANVLNDVASRNLKYLTDNSDTSAVQSTRRDQIIRRCLALSPPIEAKELEGLLSFKAALTIAKEMDDQQWGILKTRLEAESANNRVCHDQTSRKFSVPRFTKAHEHPDPRVEFDQSMIQGDPHYALGQNQADSYGTIQGTPLPALNLRTMLASIAKDIKRDRWNDANLSNKDSCLQFAVEILLLTRDTYQNHRVLRASDSALLPAHLSFADMKWLFDTQVKPLTEKYQRDVFFCHICGVASKTYGFEAVLQHFTAKHTGNFSLGTAIVNWKANWPEYPPFHPNPMLLKPLSKAGSELEAYGSFDKSQLDESYLESSQLSSEFSAELRDPIRRLEDNAPLSKPYTQKVPKAPQSFPRDSEQLHFEFASSAGSHNFPLITTPSRQRRGYTQSSLSLSGLTYAKAQDDHHMMFGRELTDLHPSLPEAVGASIAGPTTDTFRFHQAEMAKLAREYWFATAGVKGFASAARVQVIIYHACKRFVARFHLEPGVNMFLFGLNHESAMRPLRSLNGFSCQACSLEQPGALHPSNRKDSATLPHLLNHFMTAHAEYFGLDWRKDMIQLPSQAAVAELAHAPGMDETKFSLLASCFPGIFPTSASYKSLYQIQLTSPSASTANYSQSLKSYKGPVLLSDNSSREVSGYSGIICPNSTQLALCSGERNDDYDPRRPSYIGKMVNTQNFDEHGVLYEDAEAFSPWSYTSLPPETTYRNQTEASGRFLGQIQPQHSREKWRENNCNSSVPRVDWEDNRTSQHTNPAIEDTYHHGKGKHRFIGSEYEPFRTAINTNNALQEDHSRSTTYRKLPRSFPHNQGHGSNFMKEDEHGRTHYSYTSGMRTDDVAQVSEQPSQNFAGFTVAATEPYRLYALQNGMAPLSQFEDQGFIPARLFQ